jgi:hypothetical protein
VLGFLELMGTSAEVGILPFGSFPSGCAVFAGHFGDVSLVRSPRVRVSSEAVVIDVVGAAKAPARIADSTVNAFMLSRQRVLQLEWSGSWS